MKIDDPNERPGRWLRVGVGVLLLASIAGCQSGRPRVELVSYDDPYFPETFTVDLGTCVYRRDAAGDYHVAGIQTRAGEDGASEVRQYLCIRMFWHPRPGKTGDDPTTANATVRYAIVTQAGVAVYEGTAYAYPHRRRWDDRVRIDIEGGHLRLVSAVGDAPDLLGQARIRGRLFARANSGRTVEYMNMVDRLAALEHWEPDDQAIP